MARTRIDDTKVARFRAFLASRGLEFDYVTNFRACQSDVRPTSSGRGTRMEQNWEGTIGSRSAHLDHEINHRSVSFMLS